MVLSHTCLRSSAFRKSFKVGLCGSLVAANTSLLEPGVASARALPHTGASGTVSPETGGVTATGTVGGVGLGGAVTGADDAVPTAALPLLPPHPATTTTIAMRSGALPHMVPSLVVSAPVAQRS